LPGQLIARGEIRFEPASPPFAGATVHVRLEDVSLADAPARLVAEETVRGVSSDRPSATAVPFALFGPAPLEPSSTYSIRVHVSLSGARDVRVGDFVTTRAYPIAPGHLPAEVDVLVHPVR
jgi:uncharacterized lipoprotein YbaY